MADSASFDRSASKNVTGRSADVVKKSSAVKSVTIGSKKRRQVVVKRAIHSGEMEGLHVSQQGRADAAEYVAGHIDSDQLVARARARYGLD